MKILILFILLVSSFQVVAETEKLFVGFGEIPFLADSFKPSLGYSRKLGQIEMGLYVQLEETLRRDDDSFNADFGQDGLISSKPLLSV